MGREAGGGIAVDSLFEEWLEELGLGHNQRHLLRLVNVYVIYVLLWICKLSPI